MTPAPDSSPAARKQRTLVSLQGLSLGDAFGETYFVEDAAGRVARRELRDGPWHWTDDSAMACSIVEELAQRGRVDQDDLARRFAARYRAESTRGYGAGAQQLLSSVAAGAHWHQASRSLFGGGSFGNGAAMRVAVLGAWFADDLERVAHEARLSAEVTHAHPEGVAGAMAVAAAAALACRGEVIAGPRFLDALRDWVPDSAVLRGISRAIELHDALPADVASELGNGSQISAQDTVPFALWCAATTLTDYEEALWRTVSGLGDRDTTCAIVGGIVACRVGADGLPVDWLRRREPLPALEGLDGLDRV